MRLIENGISDLQECITLMISDQNWTLLWGLGSLIDCSTTDCEEAIKLIQLSLSQFKKENTAKDTTITQITLFRSQNLCCIAACAQTQSAKSIGVVPIAKAHMIKAQAIGLHDETLANWTDWVNQHGRKKVSAQRVAGSLVLAEELMLVAIDFGRWKPSFVILGTRLRILSHIYSIMKAIKIVIIQLTEGEIITVFQTNQSMAQRTVNPIILHKLKKIWGPALCIKVCSQLLKFDKLITIPQSRAKHVDKEATIHSNNATITPMLLVSKLLTKP